MCSSPPKQRKGRRPSVARWGVPNARLMKRDTKQIRTEVRLPPDSTNAVDLPPRVRRGPSGAVASAPIVRWKRRTSAVASTAQTASGGSRLRRRGRAGGEARGSRRPRASCGGSPGRSRHERTSRARLTSRGRRTVSGSKRISVGPGRNPLSSTTSWRAIPNGGESSRTRRSKPLRHRADPGLSASWPARFRGRCRLILVVCPAINWL